MIKVGVKSSKFEGPIGINNDGLYSSFVYFDEFYSTRKKMKRLPERYIEGMKKKTGEKTITLIWDDKARTNVVCSKNDKYDKRLGFLIAYFQYNSGLSKTQANKYLDNLVEENKKGSK